MSLPSLPYVKTMEMAGEKNGHVAAADPLSCIPPSDVVRQELADVETEFLEVKKKYHEQTRRLKMLLAFADQVEADVVR